MKTLLKNWSVGHEEVNPYAAPETIRKYLHGEVYNHPSERHPDGKKVYTSTLVEVNGRVVTTHSGTVYHLEDPAPDYLQYLKSIEYDFDPENPINLN